MKSILTFLSGIGLFCGATFGQSAVLSLRTVPTGTTQIQQNNTITLEVFLDISALAPTTKVRGYQAQLLITPQPGAVGTLTLADTCPLSPEDPASTSIFIDTARSDYFFAPPLPPPALLFPAANCTQLIVSSAMNAPGVGPFSVAKYCGTYILRATSNAAGNFALDFQLTPLPGETSGGTFLRNQTQQAIPFTTQGVTVTAIPPIIIPANDTCANATVLSNGLTSFTTAHATTDPSGPPLSGNCNDPDDLDGTSFVNDVWYNYTATCTGIVTVSTCGMADFDTRLAVYDGDANPACLCPSLGTPEVTCDDDRPGCSDETAEVVFTATSGACYKIRLGGLSSDSVNTGTGTLSVSCLSNDTCTTATALGSLPQTVNSSTRNSNTESGLPACGGVPYTSGGVWYSVNGTGGLMTASNCATGPLFNTRLSVFTGSSCASLACVAAADNNCGIHETVSWCSTAAVPYYILVHGATGVTGDFSLTVSSAACNDGNECTTNSCSGTSCQFVDNITQPGQCCSPTTGVRLTINDNNPCNTDVCNANGSVTHPPLPNGANVACDDGLRCTFDQCLSGSCANTDINTIPCTVTANCPAGTGSICVAPSCRCIENPSLDLIPEAGSLPNPSCYSIGDIITIHVQMGFSPTPIVAAQFFLDYDVTSLSFVSLDPGRTFDVTSPFNYELQQAVNTTAGTIDYAVVVPPGNVGTANPALVAVLRFEAIAEVGQCTPFVRFRAHSPATSLLDSASPNPNVYLPITSNLPAVKINGTLPVLILCPGDMSTGFDDDEYVATVNFNAPVAIDNCEETLTTDCDPPPGSAFASGTTSVTCSAENSCGVVESCGFDVTVIPSTLTVGVELSPTIVTAARQRCVTFDLWDCASGRHHTVEQSITFNSGHAAGVQVEIPGGVWSCATARDRLHTLRSKAPTPLSTPNFSNYNTTFLGDLDQGGDWLLGGNLNDDNFIDIQDYVRFLQQYLGAPSPHTPCGTLPYHADINGSGTVDVADLSFIQVSMFQVSEPGCCPSATAEIEEPVRSVSIQELRDKGLGHLGVADLNGDDVLDPADVDAFVLVQPTLDSIKHYTSVLYGRAPISRRPEPEGDDPKPGKTRVIKPRRD